MAQYKVNQGSSLVWGRALAIAIALSLAFCAGQPLLTNDAPWWAHPNLPEGGFTAWYLAYAAAVFLVNALVGNPAFGFAWLVYGAIAGRAAVRAVTAVLCLAGAASFFTDDPAAAAPLLLIPGAFGFYSSFLRTRASPADDESAEGDEAVDDKTNEAESTWRDMFSILAFVAAWVLAAAIQLVVLLHVHSLAFSAITGELFEGEPQATEFLSRVASGTAVLDWIVPVMSGFIVYLGGLFLLVLVIGLLLYRPKVRMGPLSETEIQYLQDAKQTLHAFAEKRGLKDRAAGQWIQFISLGLLGFGLSVFFGIWVHDMSAAAGPSRVPAGSLWHIYIQSDSFGTGTALGSAAVVLTMAAWRYALRLYPDREIAVAWASLFELEERDPVRSTLTDAVRFGDIRADRAFDPESFLRQYLRSADVVYLVIGAGIAVISYLFLLLDLQHYSLLTPDRIVTVDYWTSQPSHRRYEDVDAVMIECHTWPKYQLRFSDGVSVTVELRNSRKELNALIDIDERLRARGVTVEFKTEDRLLRDPVVRYDEDCVRDFVGRRSPNRAAQIERILHLDDWRARR